MAVAKKKQTKDYKERKKVGQFFTEDTLVNEIKNIFDLSFENKTIIEPSCGEGVFIKEILKHNINSIIGIDIDKNVLKKIDLNTKLTLVNKDYLLSDFNQVDMIIGNPPFNLTSKNYLDSTEGFISKSIDLLKDGGELVLIIPSTVLRNKCYENIRKKIIEDTKIIGILNTSKYEFLGADIETLVLYLKKEYVNCQNYIYYKDKEKIKIKLQVNDRKTILLNNTKYYNSIVEKLNGKKIYELFNVSRGTSKKGINGRTIDFFNDTHYMKNINKNIFIGIQNIAYRFAANAIEGDVNLVKDTVTRLIPKVNLSFSQLRYIANYLNSSIAFYNLHNNCLNNCRLTIHIDKYYIEDFVIPLPNDYDIKEIDDELLKCKNSIEYSHKRNMFFYKKFNLSDKEIYEVEKFWANPKFKLKSEVSEYDV